MYIVKPVMGEGIVVNGEQESMFSTEEVFCNMHVHPRKIIENVHNAIGFQGKDDKVFVFDGAKLARYFRGFATRSEALPTPGALCHMTGISELDSARVPLHEFTTCVNQSFMPDLSE